MKRFRIGARVDDERLYFEVRLYDTDEEMRAAYRRTTFFLPEQDDDTTCGRVCPVRNVNGERSRIGFIFLSRNYCGTRVVSHEMIHAALEFYRSLKGCSANFGKRCSPKEELLADIYEVLFTKMTRKLHALGVWA
ncbi:hypothetical protein LCGC14_0879500 [marine sediment metagenome]|uniref:Uncharacterized protein n=1 Tax=marine sediment metagenome TaxID=412755 RepID=A0A0F9S9B9_9ZZZZ